MMYDRMANLGESFELLISLEQRDLIRILEFNFAEIQSQKLNDQWSKQITQTTNSERNGKQVKQM